MLILFSFVRDIAEWFTPDDIMRLIELIRPDLLLLRVSF